MAVGALVLVTMPLQNHRACGGTDVDGAGVTVGALGVLRVIQWGWPQRCPTHALGLGIRGRSPQPGCAPNLTITYL